MGLIVLSTNNWSFIKAQIGAVIAAVDAVKPGGYIEVEIPFGLSPRRVSCAAKPAAFF
jgi:hypothetical protein